MKPRWTICLGVFGGACLGLAASPFLSRFPFRVPHRDSLVAASSAGKAQTFNKDNHHTQVFELNSTFTEAPSPQSNRAWAALIPVGRGFITVDNNGNPISYSDDTTRSFLRPLNVRVISVFHQLHCLDELRIGFYAQNEINLRDSAQKQNGHKHKHSVDHMKHCWDYLRQALLCNADNTLEPLKSNTSEAGLKADGWGARHQCRDFERLVSWTEEHRATNEGGIT